MNLVDLVCCRKHSYCSCITYDDGISYNSQTWTYSNVVNVSTIISCILRQVFSKLSISCRVQAETVGIYGKMSPEILAAIVGVLSLPASYCPIDPSRPSFLNWGIIQSSRGKIMLVHLSLLEDFLSHSCFATNCSRLLTQLAVHGIVIAIINPNSSLESVDLSPQCTPSRMCDYCVKTMENENGAEFGNKQTVSRKYCSVCQSNVEISHPEVIVSSSAVAYVLQTSGTTGAPKKVCVPHSCIVPNITDLGRRFGMSPEDRVFNAAPLTFDPSVVEVFLSLSCGACLVAVPDAVKSTPSLLSQVLVQRQKVTVLQITPSLFGQLPSDIITTGLLGEFSFLRVLAFGGEVCPSLCTLKRWKSNKNSTKIFNIYGITEVSCWATCHEVLTLSPSPSPPIASNSAITDMVPIGECLLETKIELRDLVKTDARTEGTLWIGGTSRVCLLGEGTVLCVNTWRSSGDTAYKDEMTGNVFILGRHDRQIKRKGHRVNLDYVQQVISSLATVSSCVVLTSPSKSGLHSVVAVIVPAAAKPFQLRDLLQELNEAVPSSHIPDKFVCVDSIPVNSHGKSDLKSLLAIINHHPKSCEPALALDKAEIQAMVLDVVRTVITRLSIPGDRCLKYSLPELGANSFDVVRIINLLEDQLKQRSMLSQGDTGAVDWFEIFMKNPLKDLIDAVHNCLQSKTTVDQRKRKVSVSEEKSNKALKLDESAANTTCTCTSLLTYRRGMITFNGRKLDQSVGPNPQCGPLSLHKLWTVSTGQCVDSSPLVVVTVTSSSASSSPAMVYVGSHSGLLLSVELDSGIVRWRVQLPDRVESSACVSLCGTYIIIGCYDGCVYTVDTISGDIKWCFQTDGVSSTDPVKSSPSVHPVTGFLWFGSHDKHLYCIDINVKRRVHKLCLDGGSCFSSPTFSSDGSSVYVATLKGNFFSIHNESGRVQWYYECLNPVFSSPTVLPNGDLAFGCVNGCVYVLNPFGHQVDILKTEEAVFSSCTSAIGLSGEPLLYSGSNNGHLNCWEYINSHYQLRWKIELDGPIYSTPMISNSHPVCCEVHDKQAVQKETCLVNAHCSKTVVLCVCSNKGRLYLVDPLNGSVLTYCNLPDEVFSSPAVVGSKVIVGCRDDMVYCLEIKC